MSSLVNMQVYGVPIITYGLIGLTTAVLAYATATSDLGNVVSKAASSLTEVTENPVGAFSTSNEPAVQAEPASSSDSDSASSSDSDSDSGKTETALEGLNPFANATNYQSGEEPKGDEQKEEEPSGMTGGKKHRKKKSFRRKSNKNKRKRKSMKTKPQK